jgi:hypothetical protein
LSIVYASVASEMSGELDGILFAELDSVVNETPPEVVAFKVMVSFRVNSLENGSKSFHSEAGSGVYFSLKILHAVTNFKLGQIINLSRVSGIWGSEEEEDVLFLLEFSGNITGQTTAPL